MSEVTSAIPLDAPFVASLRDLSPAEGPEEDYLDNPWYIVAIVAISAVNYPDAIPLVFQAAVADLEARNAKPEDYLRLVRRIKDSLLKSSMLTGAPKSINSWAALHKVLKEEWKEEQTTLRDTSLSVEELTKIGQDLFTQTYGDTTGTVQPFLKSIFPDFEFYCIAFAYGYCYGHLGVTSAAETSFIMISSLIASDLPLQAGWHLQGARRNGASLQRVKAVRAISMAVAKQCGVKWKDQVPDISA